MGFGALGWGWEGWAGPILPVNPVNPMDCYVDCRMGFRVSTCVGLLDLDFIEGGLAAGGEGGPVHSAAILVSGNHPFALVDLRVDWEEVGPIEKLRRLWEAYEPQMSDYLNRAINPTAAPSYGVVGDP